MAAHMIFLRHGQREDYEAEDKLGWITGPGAARPWDPALSQTGVEQTLKAARRLRPEALARLGIAPITRIFVSPFLRCVQCGEVAAKQLGIKELLVEEGLSETMVESWFRQWAVPGADTTWDGPAHCGLGVPVEDKDLRPEALNIADTFVSARELHERVSKSVKPDHTTVFSHKDTPVRWGRWEALDEAEHRVTTTVLTRQSERPGESTLWVGHAGQNRRAAKALTKQGALPHPEVLRLTELYAVGPGTAEDPSMHTPHPKLWGCAAHLLETPVSPV
eukprot:Hpha_TRINITY_DN27467_c0_g1::TRINITY_DN27467_c0_g1_i1::g.193794::m.193794